MNGTVKTVLLVGGIAVGVVVVMRMLAPTAKVPAQPKSATQLISTQALISGIGALGGLFVGKGSSADSVPSGTVVNTAVQTSEITDAQEAAFTEGHFGADYSTL